MMTAQVQVSPMAAANRTSDPILDIEGLTIDIPVPAGMLHAVADLDLAVRPRETHCIVGESGCGKSMTALAIMGLLPAKAIVSARKLSLAGNDLRQLSERHLTALRGDRVAMIFQDPMTSLDPMYSIGSQLQEAWISHGKGSRREARERAEYLLSKVGIAAPRARLAQYPHELSGGLRQRVMIAMALMCEPALLIADEPTTALDATTQIQTLDLLKSLQDELGMGLILITHDLGVVAHMADTVTVMYAGRVAETGPSSRIFSDPLHPYTLGLINCIPALGRGQAKQILSSIRGIVPALVGDVSGCAFRTRCDYARAACGGDVPFQEEAANHRHRCVMNGAEFRRLES